MAINKSATLDKSKKGFMELSNAAWNVFNFVADVSVKDMVDETMADVGSLAVEVGEVPEGWYVAGAAVDVEEIAASDATAKLGTDSDDDALVAAATIGSAAGFKSTPGSVPATNVVGAAKLILTLTTSSTQLKSIVAGKYKVLAKICKTSQQ